MGRVAIINPPRFKGIPVVREDRCEITEKSSVLPPYSLLQIASYLREKGHQVYFLDANEKNIQFQAVGEWINEKKPEMILFRFTPTTFENDLMIASLGKSFDKSVMTVGICHTLKTVWRKVLEYAPHLDVYILSENYEEIVNELSNYLRNEGDISKVRGIAHRLLNDEIAINEERPMTKGSLDYLPLPSFDLVADAKYIDKTNPGDRFMAIATSRGCPYSCTFCTVRRTPLRMKSAKKVLEEIDALVKKHNVSRIGFFDETFTIKRDRTIDICNGLKDRGYALKWYCNTRVDCIDKELLRIMANSGCDGISYGIESGSQRILDFAGKGTTVEQGMNAILLAKEMRIKVYASFVIGLPGENEASLAETIRFIKLTKPNGAQFNLAVPYPGTHLFELAIKNGWIDMDIDWLTFYQHKAHMRTDELTLKELEDARLNMYKSLFFDPKWIWENIKYLFREPSDFVMGARYYYDNLKGIALCGMSHKH